MIGLDLLKSFQTIQTDNKRMTCRAPGRPGFDRQMTKEEINACPIEQWAGPVSVVRTADELDRAVDHLARHTLLGFDTETRPAYRKGESYSPSLLQLASSDAVFLFQLGTLGFTEPLRGILTDPSITKVGVGLDYDIRELNKLYPFEAAGFVDLARLARQTGVRSLGLRGMAAVLLGFRIPKGAQTSNWANDELSPQQIRYAATDAWVGRELYLALKRSPLPS